MRHLPVFLNLLSLILGMVCLVELAATYARGKDAKRLSRLAFFASYSFLMLVAFFFSYYLINIGSGLSAERAFASLSFLGMALVETTFFRMLLPAGRKAPSSPPPAAVLVASGLTAAQAGILWMLPNALSAIAFAAAFIPFFSVISWALAGAARHGKDRQAARPANLLFLLYVPVGAFAAIEAISLFRSPPPSGYALLSLPLAYALTSVQFFLSAQGEKAETEAMAELPRPLVERAKLTAREEEMARLILKGKENKEIAGDLLLSENTVRNHIYNMYQKLGIQRRMDLLRLIREEGRGSGT
jgi:DNA-binding CsgD family transcriptional regulator/UPF0716 family protein affecting phage T7 exclusion